jgi:hypothetical protein
MGIVAELVVAAIPATIAGGVGVYLSKRVAQVHVLVNSSMTEALRRIEELEGEQHERERLLTAARLAPAEHEPLLAQPTAALPPEGQAGS